jgi:hypothetical protein
MLLIKHCVKLQTMDTYIEGSEYNYIQDSDLKSLEVGLRLHCKYRCKSRLFRITKWLKYGDGQKLSSYANSLL